MIVFAIIERKSGQRDAVKYGQSIGAMGLESLDQYLRQDDVTPLSDFAHEGTATLEQALKVARPAEKPAIERRLQALRAQPDWHDPQAGLTTVQTLIDRLPADERHAGVVADLKVYHRILNEASAAGDLFRLNVVTSD